MKITLTAVFLSLAFTVAASGGYAPTRSAKIGRAATSAAPIRQAAHGCRVQCDSDGSNCRDACQ